jgi:hypothetical protein
MAEAAGAVSRLEHFDIPCRGDEFQCRVSNPGGQVNESITECRSRQRHIIITYFARPNGVALPASQING